MDLFLTLSPKLTSLYIIPFWVASFQMYFQHAADQSVIRACQLVLFATLRHILYTVHLVFIGPCCILYIYTNLFGGQGEAIVEYSIILN